MAFSTQKEFFHVPFMNESLEFECQEVCVKLKTYPSTFDDRSWAANEDKKSRFVSDLVSCNTPMYRRGQDAQGRDKHSQGKGQDCQKTGQSGEPSIGGGSSQGKPGGGPCGLGGPCSHGSPCKTVPCGPGSQAKLKEQEGPGGGPKGPCGGQSAKEKTGGGPCGLGGPCSQGSPCKKAPCGPGGSVGKGSGPGGGASGHGGGSSGPCCGSSGPGGGASSHGGGTSGPCGGASGHGGKTSGPCGGGSGPGGGGGGPPCTGRAPCSASCCKGHGGGSAPGDLLVGDSLINAADNTIGTMKDLMVKNNLLQKQLADSKDRLCTATQENAEIKRIMNERYDPEKSKAFQNKIKQLTDAKKIDKCDAKELCAIQKSIDDMNKAYEILEVENANLRRLIEKQSKRVTMEAIKVDPEKSSDVKYLQCKIDKLGRELALLRQTEDESMRSGELKGSYAPDMDADNIQKMLAERDALRRKMKGLNFLEDKVNKLQSKADQADHASCNMCKNLNAQNQYINEMESEIEEMQKYYENEVEQSKYNEEILKCRCNDLKKQVSKMESAAKRCECMQDEIGFLRNELRKRDTALSAYDCQYQQLMNVISELNKKYGNQRGDCPDDKKCPDVGEDLTFYTGATLDHIMKEMCKQADCFKKMNQGNSPDSQGINNIDDCMSELQRLRNLLKEKDSQLGDLIEDNTCMCDAAIESNKKLTELDKKVRELDRDTRCMEEGMRESINLIEDIGDVAKENEKLKDKVNNMKSSELQQQLDDCLEYNKTFKEALKKLGVDPDSLPKGGKSGDSDSLSKGGKSGDHPCDSLDTPCNDDTCPDDICKIKRVNGPDGQPPSKNEGFGGDDSKKGGFGGDDSKKEGFGGDDSKKGGFGGDDDIDNLKKQLEDCLKDRRECEELNKTFKDALRENGIDPDNLGKGGKGGQGGGPGGQGGGSGGQAGGPGGQEGGPGGQGGGPGGQGGGPGGQGGKDGKDCEDLDYSCHDDTCPDNVCPVKKAGGVDDGDGLSGRGGLKGDGVGGDGVGGDGVDGDGVDGDGGKGGGGKVGGGKGGGKTGGLGDKDGKDGAGGAGQGGAGQGGADDDANKGENDANKGGADADGKNKGASDKNKRGKSMTGASVSGADRGSAAASRSGRDSKSGKPGSSKGKGGAGGKNKGKDGSTEEHFEEFVKNTMKSLNAGEIDGCGLEKELRKILDMFIDECGFCFCKCNIPKSRFYAICHKLYHLGLHTLEFKDLAYMHKRIFAAAENILPGCLFNIIMKDILSGSPQGIVPVSAAPSLPLPSLPAAEQQCCSCKSSLCCNDTDEKLMMKVMRLENDIENAKQCLLNLKNIPSDLSVADFRLEAGDCFIKNDVHTSTGDRNSIVLYKEIKNSKVRNERVF